MRFLVPLALTVAVVAGNLALADEKPADEKSSAPAAEPPAGERIYRQQCASCHGERGEGGTDDYSAELHGDASIGELTEIISDTMPEEDPTSCEAEDARAVAEYIHHAFYSPAARLRNRPAQRKLSRLTASQLQQSLADLYQHFYGPVWREEKRGLTGQYFDAGRWDKKKRRLERIDPVLDFDFGRESPVEGVSAKEFFIHWSGSLQVEHTGRYEIVVETTCSMKMRFGNDQRVLIDNHVQSEGKTEFRRTLNLIGGRQYSIAIDFTQRKRKTELPPAKFALRWVPPGGEESVIPTEVLLPNEFPSTFALQTKLPPDDRSYGYDRGTSVNRIWDDSVTRAAIEFGTVAADEIWPHYRKRNPKLSDENRGRLRSFLGQLLTLAFRQSLSEDSKALYIDQQLAAEPDDQQAIRRVCVLAIKSPRFLYPSVDPTISLSQRVANDLSLTLHDSLPVDPWLLKMAGNDFFETNPASRVRRAAERLSNDPRLHGKVMEMFFEWLDVDPKAELTKDQTKFPGFDRHLTMDLKRSLEKTVTDVFWSSSSDYRQLFQRDWAWTTQRLAEFYGDGWNPGGPVQSNALVKSESAPGKTLGVLTHPLVMSHLSYFDTTSPIHRGVFLVRRVLGRSLRPPNEAFTPLNPNLHPELTTRERVELQTGGAKCQVCHQKINALGFPLENYDAVGRFRAQEKSRPIDASGGYTTTNGTFVKFDSAKDLADFLAENEDAHRAFIERVFEHFAKQPIAAFGVDTSDRLLQKFRETQYNMKALVVEVAVTVAMQQIDLEESNEST